MLVLLNCKNGCMYAKRIKSKIKTLFWRLSAQKDCKHIRRRIVKQSFCCFLSMFICKSLFFRHIYVIIKLLNSNADAFAQFYWNTALRIALQSACGKAAIKRWRVSLSYNMLKYDIQRMSSCWFLIINIMRTTKTKFGKQQST